MNIVNYQLEVDNMVKQIPGIAFFVSSITGTMSQLERDQHGQQIGRKTYPGVAHWVVSTGTSFQWQSLFCKIVQSQGATVRPVHGGDLEPKNIFPSLTIVLKDNIAGYVRRMVEASASESLKMLWPASHPVARLYVLDDKYLPMLTTAQVKLAEAKFHIALEKYDLV